MRKKTIVKQRSFRIAKAIVCVLLLLYSVSLIFPTIWAFLLSLKDQIELNYNPTGLPEKWLFSNYVDAFKILAVNTDNGKVYMFGLLANSLWYSIGAAFLGIFVSSMSAYVVAKYEFPGRKFVYGLVLIVMMIPIVGGLPSQYKVYTALGIIDTPFYLIVFANGFGFNFLILHGYFKNLPWSYAESAFIDGAGRITVFFKIMMPQALTTLVALGSLALIGAWNDYSNPLLFLKTYPTLSSGLFIFRMQTQRMLNQPVLYAGILMSVIPVIALFTAFSNKIMDISLGGGLKG